MSMTFLSAHQELYSPRRHRFPIHTCKAQAPPTTGLLLLLLRGPVPMHISYQEYREENCNCN